MQKEVASKLLIRAPCPGENGKDAMDHIEQNRLLRNKESITNIIQLIFDRIEVNGLFFLKKIFGLPLIIRYLRNPNPRLSVKILRKFGATIGQQTTFKGAIFIDNSYEDENSSGDLTYLKIGHNCYIGDEVYFDLSNEIIIEDNVIVSGRSSFVTHMDCNRSIILNNYFPRKCGPIRIKENVWIAFGATVLQNVTVGEQSVIAANALLKEDSEPRYVYAGIPAKKIKNLVPTEKT